MELNPVVKTLGKKAFRNDHLSFFKGVYSLLELKISFLIMTTYRLDLHNYVWYYSSIHILRILKIFTIKIRSVWSTGFLQSLARADYVWNGYGVMGHPIKTEIVRRGRIEIRCWLWNVSLHVACFDLPEWKLYVNYFVT